MKSKIKLMLVSPNLEGGGAERVITHIANGIDKQKFDVTLCLIRKQGVYLSFLNDDIKIVDLKKDSVKSAFFKLIKIIRQEKPDVVMSTLGHLNIMLAFMKIFLSKNVSIITREVNIYSLQKNDFIYGVFRRIFYRNVHKIVAQSDDMSDDLISNSFLNKDKIHVINNPIDFMQLKSRTDEINLVSRNKDVIELVSVGRLSHQKGYDILLNMFSKISNKDRYHITIVGDGELKGELEHLRDCLGLNLYVDFVGFSSNPFLYIVNSDVFISSSRHEGFPNVVLEAMSCGKPVLSNDYLGGINEIINNKNGVVIDISNNVQFEKGISKCLKLNSNEIINNIKDKYDINVIVEQYQDLFNSCI